MTKLVLNKLTKTFERRVIFKDVNLEWSAPGLFGVAGPNGSGKSTLVKVVTGLISATSGEVYLESDGKKFTPANSTGHFGFASPYLVLYDEFTAKENLEFTMNIRGKQLDEAKMDSLLDHFSLLKRKNDLVRAYSSGMKQRLKIIFAFIHNPELIILDEPTANLDAEGKGKVYELAKSIAQEKIVIFATNEEEELAMCKEVIKIMDHKPAGRD
ncbi:MAG: ABC transporter ATP-binding protein [Ignavibacteria bacterium]|nr:ABC transporter ATP-binding protein [Ignavibacteria bacterium]